jgi:hypothetical protein
VRNFLPARRIQPAGADDASEFVQKLIRPDNTLLRDAAITKIDIATLNTARLPF